MNLANHLWQSTLFAVAALPVAFALRRHRAAVRYRIWLAASIKFLAPFSALLALGGRVEWHAAAVPAVAAPISTAIVGISEPFAVSAPVPASAAPMWPAVLTGIWIAGIAVVCARWWVRWRRVRSALRSATPLAVDAPVEVRCTAARLEPGIFGVFRPVLLLPEGLAERLSPEEFGAILAHEFCHLRRRDNVAAATHMVVEAVFWFHPLVWWIGARLIEERERACDEEVVRGGSHREAYAAGILSVCRFYMESPLACASGVTGGNLGDRIEAIMTMRLLPDLTLAAKLVLATACATAIAVPFAAGLLHAQAAPLRFEVASIKPTKGGGSRGGMQVLPGGALRMTGATLKNLIAFAYDTREERISGGPAWTGSVGYDIDARPERADAGTAMPAPGTTSWQRLEQRLQTLLAERFHLVIHKDSKEGPVYVLVLAKGGFKLQPSQQPDDVPPGTMRSRGQINGRAGTIRMLATVLSNFLGRQVEDRTGLTGRYDYKLEYAQDTIPGEPADDAPGGSIFWALQQQLGLKIESARGAIETVVIDRATRPSAN